MPCQKSEEVLMGKRFKVEFSSIALSYLVITISMFVVSIFCSAAGFRALKEFFLALIENFDMHMAMQNLIEVNIDEGYECPIFILSMLQVTYISRIVGKFIDDETYLDKIIMLLSNACLSCFLNITYTLYPMRFLQSMIGVSPIYVLLAVGCIYSLVKAILVVKKYEWGAYLFVGKFIICIFINPIALGVYCVVFPFILGIQIYAWLYDAFLYKNIILLIIVVLLISYPVNAVIGKVTDLLLDIVNGGDSLFTDIFYGFFSIALIIAWFVFMFFKTEYTDLTFNTGDKTYTYKAVKTIDRGIETGNIWWGYFKDGTLIIDGQYGHMLDYGFNNSPWYKYRDKIKRVAILNGTTYIGDCAFSGLCNVREIDIPLEVNEIGNMVFLDCNMLKKIYVDIKNNTYSTDGGSLYNKKKTVLLRCPDGKETIKIPETVIKLEEDFSRNEVLKEINVNSNNKIFSSHNGILYSRDKTKLIRCPIGKKECIVGEDVKKIESSAFMYCCNLESVILPDRLEDIGYYSFAGCRKLKRIEIPESVKIINGYAFMDCDELEEVIFKGNATEIRKDVFIRSNPRLVTSTS